MRKTVRRLYRRVKSLTPVFVDFIPEHPEPGCLYISRKYRTATHLCCCGCGSRVVTPLKKDFWSIREEKGCVWLSPSIGNWSLACRSHYFIRGNRVDWLDEDWELPWIARIYRRVRKILQRFN